MVTDHAAGRVRPCSHPARRHGRPRLAWALPLAVALLLGGCATSTYDRGRSLLESGDPPGAIAAFDTSIEEGERLYEATRERGAAHLEAGRAEAAIEDLEAAREMRSPDVRLYWLLGRAYGQAERWAESAEAYRAYEERTRVRSAQELARKRVAQLEHEFDRAAAREIMVARRGGQPPERNSLAVYAFRPESGESASLQDVKICRALNIWVSADLAKVKAARSIALDQMQAIYEEQGIGYDQVSGADPRSALAMGNIQPARHMVQGLYGSLDGERVVLGASCYDVTSEEATSCSARDGRRKDLFDLETQLVLDLLESLDIEVTAAERRAIGEKPTRDLEAFLLFADGAYLQGLGQHDAAAAAFQQAASLDPGFEMAVEHAAAASVAAAPAVSITVPPPPLPSDTADRLERSSQFLGLGITPEGSGATGGAETTDVVTVRGEATLSIRGRAGQNR